MAKQMGGYYVMRLKNYSFAPAPFHHLFTVCTDFNDNLLEDWAWEKCGGKNLRIEAEDDTVKQLLADPEADLEKIRSWVSSKYNSGKLKWGETFGDLATAYEYRNRFFQHLPDTYILSITFLEEDVPKILQPLKDSYTINPWELEKEFSKPIMPKPGENGKVIGYDILKVELGVVNLDSFLIHSIGWDIYDLFGVPLNRYGLLNDDTKRELIMSYMNHPENPVEEGPWFWTKVKLFN